jgi:glycosyltransferase involved in cell wall biosynthesis
MNPKVSIIIPAYNQGHYLSKALQSTLDQSYSDFEVVVVDDGSTDDTKAVTQVFSDERIQYLYQENQGLSAARNTGVQNTSGEFLTYLDSDDMFVTEKLQLMVDALEAHPEYGFVAGQAIIIDENDGQQGQIFDRPAPENPEELLLWNPFHVSGVMLRRSWQERAGLFDENLRAYEDWDMWLRLGRLGCKMGWVPKPVSLYRFHSQQMTQDRARMTTATFAVLGKVFSDPELPESWLQMKELAYSNAYLRAAIQAYKDADWGEAEAALSEAVRLDPNLKAENGNSITKRLSALADSPKVSDKLGFLEQIYDHLPDNLESLQSQRNEELSRVAVELGFAAYQKHEYSKARTMLWRAVGYQPRWLANRGVISILLRSYF